MNVDGLDEEWALRKRIPTLAVLLELFISRHPVEGMSTKREMQLDGAGELKKNNQQ